MTATEILGLFAAAMAAGAINAVAGGGTLVTFPTLLFFGTGPIIANATSTLALTHRHGGQRLWLPPASSKRQTLALAFCSRQPHWRTGRQHLADPHLQRHLRQTGSLSHPVCDRPVSVAGSLPAHCRTGKTRRAGGTSRIWGAVLFQFAVAVYGGYFGAGIGILMLASLGFIGLADIYEMNTLKTVLGSLINLVASSGSFLPASLIGPGPASWPPARLSVITSAPIIPSAFRKSAFASSSPPSVSCFPRRCSTNNLFAENSSAHACGAGAYIPMSTPSRFAASASTHLTSARKFSSVGLSAFAL